MAESDKAVAGVPGDRGMAPVAAVPGPMLALHSDGKLVFEGIVVGRYDREGACLKLNLGWCREAGLHVKALSDPEVDRSRSGVVLDR